MLGHKADAARGKVFTKLGRELLIAVKQGGPDPAGNSKLKDVIAKCKAANMPNDTINNAIKKASGAGNAENYEEVIYVRHVFDRAGGNLGTTGCVSYMFNKKGVMVVDKAECKQSEDDLMMIALDAGAEDFEADEECYTITTTPEDFSSVRETLEGQGIEFLEAEVQMVPTTYVALDEKAQERMDKLLENLDELDDVMNVYHNSENN